MPKYEFRERPLTLKGKPDAQRIGEFLDKIKRETPGRCNSRTFLTAAQNVRGNPIRPHLEWNDKIAGDRYRLHQVRDLIQCVIIVGEQPDEPERAPAFLSFAVGREGRGYHTVREVLDSADLQAAALRQADADLAAYERRLAQFTEICEALREARARIKARRDTQLRKGKRDDHRPSA